MSARLAIAVVALLAGAALAPLELPILSVDQFMACGRGVAQVMHLHSKDIASEHRKIGLLPAHAISLSTVVLRHAFKTRWACRTKAIFRSGVLEKPIESLDAIWPSTKEHI